jgi:hypothetical protein
MSALDRPMSTKFSAIQVVSKALEPCALWRHVFGRIKLSRCEIFASLTAVKSQLDLRVSNLDKIRLLLV